MSQSPQSQVSEVQIARYHELASGDTLQWLWDGYLAPANVTLLTSQWKAGKTTLVSALLHHMESGGSLAGRAVRPGAALVLSEEDPALWFECGRRFDYADHVWWICRPFKGKPSKRQFQLLLDKVLTLHAEHSLSLLVMDSLSAFLPPGSENSADAMVAFLGSLQKLTAAGLAILILHHPRKTTAGEGLTARGSGALSGAVDVLIEMHWVGRPSAGDRRRRLKSWSRHPQTPARLIIELNKSATDYTTAPEPKKRKPPEDDMSPPLREVLSDACYKMTRHEILDAWPRHSRRPSDNRLWRWLNRAQQHKLINDGAGHPTDTLPLLAAAARGGMESESVHPAVHAKLREMEKGPASTERSRRSRRSAKQRTFRLAHWLAARPKPCLV